MIRDRINDITAFLRAADVKSFTMAGEQLGVSRSAVGKSVTRLENRLGIRLLNRTTRSVSLTDEGNVFYKRCTRIVSDLEEAEMAMINRSDVPRGRLRIDLPVSFGRLHVQPILQQFLESWPEVDVCVSYTDRFIDLIDEGIDLVIRLGGAEDSRLRSRALAPHRLVTCATPEYLAAYGTPHELGELSNHSCLPFVHAGRPVDWRFKVNGKEEMISVRGRFSATNAESLRDATLAGNGIAQLATFLIGDYLRADKLIPLLSEFEAEGSPIRAVYPSNRHLSPRVRYLIDELAHRWRPIPPWEVFESTISRLDMEHRQNCQ